MNKKHLIQNVFILNFVCNFLNFSCPTIVSVSFEILPSKLKKFETILKLPGVVFSISLIIYTIIYVRTDYKIDIYYI